MLTCWGEECKTTFTKENTTAKPLRLPWQQELTSDAIVKAAGHVHMGLLGAGRGERGWAQDPIMREMGKCTWILVTKAKLVTAVSCKAGGKKTKCILSLHDIFHRRLLKHSSLSYSFIPRALCWGCSHPFHGQYGQFSDSWSGEKGTKHSTATGCGTKNLKLIWTSNLPLPKFL